MKMTGGAVEAVFWVREVMNQWRVKGHAVVLGDPAGGDMEESSRREVSRFMRRLGSGGDDEGAWSWERLVTTYFANHSPVMRGLFLSVSVSVMFSLVVRVCGLLTWIVYRLVQSSPAWSS